MPLRYRPLSRDNACTFVVDLTKMNHFHPSVTQAVDACFTVLFGDFDTGNVGTNEAYLPGVLDFLGAAKELVRQRATFEFDNSQMNITYRLPNGEANYRTLKGRLFEEPYPLPNDETNYGAFNGPLFDRTYSSSYCEANDLATSDRPLNDRHFNETYSLSNGEANYRTHVFENSTFDFDRPAQGNSINYGLSQIIQSPVQGDWINNGLSPIIEPAALEATNLSIQVQGMPLSAVAATFVHQPLVQDTLPERVQEPVQEPVQETIAISRPTSVCSVSSKHSALSLSDACKGSPLTSATTPMARSPFGGLASLWVESQMREIWLRPAPTPTVGIAAGAPPRSARSIPSWLMEAAAQLRFQPTMTI